MKEKIYKTLPHKCHLCDTIMSEQDSGRNYDLNKKKLFCHKCSGIIFYIKKKNYNPRSINQMIKYNFPNNSNTIFLNLSKLGILETQIILSRKIILKKFSISRRYWSK